ncbi:MAG TPA: hypothetical protein VHY37_01985 [Tepidisphaeraceae bacterium]|jgi:hypothetical protein|nr:hypothetical protein [Tepidisphaeraceae bacterium]
MTTVIIVCVQEREAQPVPVEPFNDTTILRRKMWIPIGAMGVVALAAWIVALSALAGKDFLHSNTPPDPATQHLYLWVALLVTVLGIPVACLAVRNLKILLARGVWTTAAVESISSVGNGGNRPVTFSYAVGGKSYRIKRDVPGMYISQYSAGSQVNSTRLIFPSCCTPRPRHRRYFPVQIRFLPICSGNSGMQRPARVKWRAVDSARRPPRIGQRRGFRMGSVRGSMTGTKIPSAFGDLPLLRGAHARDCSPVDAEGLFIHRSLRRRRHARGVRGRWLRESAERGRQVPHAHQRPAPGGDS